MRGNVGWGNKEYYFCNLDNCTRVENKIKFDSAVTVIIIVTADFNLWPFSGRRLAIIIPAVR
jgi:hypothetical protein